jgi:hypothetical protein
MPPISVIKERPVSGEGISCSASQVVKNVPILPPTARRNFGASQLLVRISPQHVLVLVLLLASWIAFRAVVGYLYTTTTTHNDDDTFIRSLDLESSLFA